MIELLSLGLALLGADFIVTMIRGKPWLGLTDMLAARIERVNRKLHNPAWEVSAVEIAREGQWVVVKSERQHVGDDAFPLGLDEVEAALAGDIDAAHFFSELERMRGELGQPQVIIISSNEASEVGHPANSIKPQTSADE